MRGLTAISKTLSILACLTFLPCSLKSQAGEQPSKDSTKTASKPAGLNADHRAFSLGELPLQFEENLGQADLQAHFLARGSGYTLFLNSDGVVMSLAHGKHTSPQSISMHLLGIQPGTLVGSEQTATHTDYYLGKNPSSWHLNVRSYHSVSYPNLYKGIDLVYHGNGNQLEYDFVVAPDADPGQVRMRFDGLKLKMQGDDLGFEGASDISVRALKAFQLISGEKRPVEAAWVIDGDQASISLGSYDHKHKLVIDPVFFYGSYIGGDGSDSAVSIVPADTPNYFYIALSVNSGFIEEPSLPGKQCNPPADPATAPDCFPNSNINSNTPQTFTLIMELNATGSPSTSSPTGQPSTYPSIAKAVYIGSTSSSTTPKAMVADSAFNLYVTGTNTAATFPQMGMQVCLQSCPGFLVRLDKSLNLKYSSGFPAMGYGIAADADGNAYLTGAASAGSLSPVDSEFQKLVVGGSDPNGPNPKKETYAFLSEINATGKPLFNSYIGGSGSDQGNSITLSGSGTVYVAGVTSSNDFPASTGPKFSGGQSDAFVVAAKISSAASSLVYSTYLGGTGDDSASSIAVDSMDNLVLAGSTTSTDFPATDTPFSYTYLATDNGKTSLKTVDLTNSALHLLDSAQSAFISGLSAKGELRFSDFLGGPDAADVTSAEAIQLDPLGVIYVTGDSSATTVPTDFLGGNATSDNRVNPFYTGGSNVFFAQIDPSGERLLETTIAGGDQADVGKAISISGPQASIGTVSIVGSTTSVPSVTTNPFFASASQYPGQPNNTAFPHINPIPTDGTEAGFFIQELIAGFCNMQVQSQTGPSVTLQGNCVSGTTGGTLYLTDANGNPVVPSFTPVPFTTAQNASGQPSATISKLDLSAYTGSQVYLNFIFSPVGAVGGLGGCGVDDNGQPVGCGIPTSGGGGGTIFSVTSGKEGLTVTCPACSLINGSYTVQAGSSAVAINTTPENLTPPTVNWAASTTLYGSLDPTKLNATSTETFTPTNTGGSTTITATSNADATLHPSITIATLVPTSIVISGTSFTYGASIPVTITGNSTTIPTGTISYTVSGSSSKTGTVPLDGNGNASIPLAGLPIGSYNIKVDYAGYAGGDDTHYLSSSSNTQSFTVTKAQLTVMANSIPPIQYGPIQVLPCTAQPSDHKCYTITGFQYGEDDTKVSGMATVTADDLSKPGETLPPGTYKMYFPDSGQMLSADNYTFSYVSNVSLQITALGATPAPLIGTAPGTYTASQTVTITDSLSGASIYYTIDGTLPDSSKISYTGPIMVSRTEIVQAIATAAGHDPSAVTSASFVLAPPALSKSSLTFGTVAEGSTSAPQMVTFTNQGLNQLGGITFGISGGNAAEFAAVTGTTCVGNLSPGANCIVAIAFTPGAIGARSATLTFSYSGIGSPQPVTLEGMGGSPLAIVSPPNQLVAGTTFQFTASAPAIWTTSAGTITAAGFFTAPDPPPSPATVTITATSINNPDVVATSQVTIVPEPVVTVPANSVLPAGGTVSVPLSLNAGTGIPGELMAVACTPATLPSNVTCAFTPNPIVNAAAGTSFTLQLSSNPLTAASPERRRPWQRIPIEGSVIVVACCVLFRSRRMRKLKAFALLAILLSSIGLLSVTACGTGGSFKTSQGQGFVTGTYTINVSVTGASLGAPDYNQTLTVFPVKVTIQ